MGALFSVQAPPPVVLVPPSVDGSSFFARSRMAESSYDVLFGKAARKLLFEEYYADSDKFVASLMLRPPEDPNVDFVLRVSTGEEFKGDAVFRWQRDVDDPNTFLELKMGTSAINVTVQACTFDTTTGLGAFTTFPVLTKSRSLEDQNIIGLRYGSSNLSVGATVDWISKGPERVWMVGKMGKVTAGCQYKPYQSARTTWREYPLELFMDTGNWSFVVDYGTGKRSVLTPNFNFSLELQENSKVIASFYHHLVVQRQVRNPFEGSDVVAITNYIDVGFEFQQRLKDLGIASFSPHNSPKGSIRKDSSESDLSMMQIGASWQANKNIFLKAKLGMLNSGAAFMLKSWWNPSFIFSCSYVRDHVQMQTNIGFGVRLENFGGARYERADANYVMITPTEKHLAEGLSMYPDAYPMLNTDITSENGATIPVNFRPEAEIL